MNAPVSRARLTRWAPVRQWVVPLAILAAAFLFHLAAPGSSLTIQTIYVSLLMLAFMQPVINALRPNYLKNLGVSALIFLLHASVCYAAFRLLRVQDMFNPKLFAAILVFYIMATIVSMLFRGIYILISEA